MAIRKRGKQGYWHAYYVVMEQTPDGWRRKRATVNLYTADKKTAEAMDADLRKKSAAIRARWRLSEQQRRMDVAAGVIPDSAPSPVVVRADRRRRLKLADALPVAEKKAPVGMQARQRWRHFVRHIPAACMDEVTPDMALSYLDSLQTGNGNNFNSAKSSLNRIFRLCLIEAGMAVSPFQPIVNRRVVKESQRPFTEDEFRRLYQMADEPWRTAIMIAWHTGLRKIDVLSIRWSDIDGDVLTLAPAKTRRFGRAVRIPLHPQAMAAIAAMPHIGDAIFAAWPDAVRPDSDAYKYGFKRLLDRAGITDTADGRARFNSLRNSFITRCDAAQIPRPALRGVVGHMSDSMTDLYSRDLDTARLIQRLPAVDCGDGEKK